MGDALLSVEGPVLLGVNYTVLRGLSAADKLRAAADVLPYDESVGRLIIAMAVVDIDRQQKGLDQSG